MSPTSGFAAIPRILRVAGRLRVPGDKSISHRYAMLAAIADGTSHLTGYAPGADCAATLACLEGLGVRVTRAAGAVTVEGLGLGGLRAPAGPLDAANSGTSMRLFAGLLAAHPFKTVIGGDASLSRRPMRRVIEPLTRMGPRSPPSTASAAHHRRRCTNFTRLRCRAGEERDPARGLHAEGRTTVVERSPHGSYGRAPMRSAFRHPHQRGGRRGPPPSRDRRPHPR